MTDEECMQLLRLLKKYVDIGTTDDITISELADDLAMSMDVTTDEADDLRAEIQGALGA